MKQCPRCGGDMPPHPGAVSREDNATEVCPGCGREEAMIAFARWGTVSLTASEPKYLGWAQPPKGEQR